MLKLIYRRIFYGFKDKWLTSTIWKYSYRAWNRQNKALFKEFGGTSVYFPTEKMIYKEARDREIISEYNGFNHKELATKYNMSESYIRAIINRHKKSA